MSPPVERCPRCRGREQPCWCDQLEAVETRVRVVVLQHVLEREKTSNTARLVPLVLRQAELRPYADPHRPLRTEGLDNAPGTTLLFPDGTQLPNPAEVRQLVVVDGSWSQARRMVQRLEVLRRLPRLSLEVPEPVVSLRTSPQGGLSTLQALARALALLGERNAAEALEDAHRRLVERTLAARGYV